MQRGFGSLLCCALFALVFFFVIPKVSEPVLMRHPDTELQMGAVGPRQLVSARGLEFTVGIKYETNIIIRFAGLFNQLFPFAQEGKQGLIVQDAASQW